MAFEAGFQARDLEDLAAVLVEVDELELAEEVLGSAFEPQEAFEAFAVEEGGLLEVEDEIDDLPLVDTLDDDVAQGFGGAVGGQVAVESDHADVVVVL